jgi:quercetin dioxygenase-like cupin family protein
MWQIASGLDTSFSAFFATDPRLLVSTNVFPDDKNMRVKTVFSYQPDTKMEVFEIEMTDFHRQSSEPHAAGVVEHVCVQKGTLEIFVDGEWNRVNEGESLRFRADQEHRYRAMSELVRFQNIVCYTR